MTFPYLEDDEKKNKKDFSHLYIQEEKEPTDEERLIKATMNSRVDRIMRFNRQKAKILLDLGIDLEQFVKKEVPYPKELLEGREFGQEIAREISAVSVQWECQPRFTGIMSIINLMKVVAYQRLDEQMVYDLEELSKNLFGVIARFNPTDFAAQNICFNLTVPILQQLTTMAYTSDPPICSKLVPPQQAITYIESDMQDKT